MKAPVDRVVVDVVTALSAAVGVEGCFTVTVSPPDCPVIPILVPLVPRIMFEVGRIPKIPKPGPGMGVDKDRDASPPKAFILFANAGLGPGLPRAGAFLLLVLLVGRVVEVVEEL